MAQWRPLHRRITSSDKVIQLAEDPFALWLYCALLPHTDADGRINGNPAGLAGTVFEGFGYSSHQLEAGLNALADVGLIVLYRNGRNQYLVQYTKFQEMCRPDKREARSELPGPRDEGSEVVTGNLPEEFPEPSPDPSAETPGELREDSAKTPRLHMHVHVHEQLHEQKDTRAPRARSGSLKETKPKKPDKGKAPPFDAAMIPLPEFVSPDVWRDFVEDRKTRKRPLTPRAVELTLADLAKTPLDADEMLKTSIKRGWTGVFPLDRNKPRPASAVTDAALDQYRKRGL